MATPKIALPVDNNSYNVNFGNNVLSTALEGGASRFRKDLIGATHLGSVQWTTDVAGYRYLMAFWRTSLDYGSLPMIIDLVIDDAEVAEYTARIVPGTFGLKSQSGLEYVVGCQLEVEADLDAGVNDATIISDYEGT